MSKPTISWQDAPEEHNYPAAKSYLGLILDDAVAGKIAAKLQKCPLSHFKAKDIFRASGLSLLGVSNSHVLKDQRKVEAGKPLSPLLLVRDTELRKVIVADGYHRLCAVYAHDEDALIPCQIVSIPRRAG